MYPVHKVICFLVWHSVSSLNIFLGRSLAQQDFHPKRSASAYGRSAILATVLSTLAAGCQENKIAQCDRLTTVANQTVSEVQTIVQANAAPSGDAFSQVAIQYDRGIVAMREINLSNPQLQAYQQRFVAFYTDVAESARSVAQGIGEQNLETAKQAYGAFQSATSLEVPLVQEMNTYCGSSLASP